MEIEIKDYISDDEMRKIVEAEFREIIRRKLSDEKQFERIFSNAAFSLVWERVDEAMDKKAKTKVREKVIEIINNMTSYSVFREARHGEPSSKGQEIVCKAIEENKDVIKQKIKDMIEKYDYEAALTKNADFFTEMIVDVLRSGLRGKEAIDGK